MRPVEAKSLVTEPVVSGDGAHRVTWDLAADHPGLVTSNFTARVTVTPLGDTSPVYMVIDLSAGLTAGASRPPSRGAHDSLHHRLSFDDHLSRRNCDMVMPVRALNTLLKWRGDSYPIRSGISSIGVSPASSRFASATLAAAISSVTRIPNTFA